MFGTSDLLGGDAPKLSCESLNTRGGEERLNKEKNPLKLSPNHPDLWRGERRGN